MSLNKKFVIVFLVTITFLLTTCSTENIDNKSPSPQQNKIDSLALVKENKAAEAAKLKHELDSLKKHLDSIKTTSFDSTKYFFL